jgi:hypothetical protein
MHPYCEVRALLEVSCMTDHCVAVRQGCGRIVAGNIFTSIVFPVVHLLPVFCRLAGLCWDVERDETQRCCYGKGGVDWHNAQVARVAVGPHQGEYAAIQKPISPWYFSYC